MKYVLIIIFTFFQCISNGQNPRDLQWIEDIEFLKKELPERHIDFFDKKNRKFFDQSLEDLSSKVSSLSNQEIALKLQQIIASFGDAHTSVNWFKLCDLNKIIPVQFHWFSDGIFILSTLPEDELILGGKLLKINSTPIETVIDSLSTLITIDNQSCVKKTIPLYMNYIELLKFFHFVQADSLTLTLELNNQTINYSIKGPDSLPNAQSYIRLKQSAVPLVMKNVDKYFYSQYFPNDQLYYIQYNKCWSKELENINKNGKNADKMPSFLEFEEKVLKEVQNDTIRKLVFDLRMNSGGSSAQGSSFIRSLYDISKVKKEMDVYVVIGRTTFSSAIINALDFQKYGKVTYVGEETSGKPNHFGELKSFNLPNSKLSIQYSTKYFKLVPGNENSIKPDVIRISSIKDYLNGNDPSMEFILSK